MGRVVIACYRPKPGKESELEKLVKSHYDRLLKENLVTERRPIILRAANNSLVEVFEWKSKEAIESAHSSASVQKMWEEFSAVCDYETAANLSEFQQLFSEFEPLN